MRPQVRDHIPLEQGLRPPASCACCIAPCQRPYSIRTRIKTVRECRIRQSRSRVRDHIPLEQGLRPTKCILE